MALGECFCSKQRRGHHKSLHKKKQVARELLILVSFLPLNLTSLRPILGHRKKSGSYMLSDDRPDHRRGLGLLAYSKQSARTVRMRPKLLYYV